MAGDGPGRYRARDELTYLASPYSAPAGTPEPDAGILRDARFKAVAHVAARMMARGVLLYCPITHTHPIAMAGELPTDFGFWERYGRRLLLSCDSVTVLCLDGWRESEGVTAEIALARELGLPVRFVDEDGAPVLAAGER